MSAKQCWVCHVGEDCHDVDCPIGDLERRVSALESRPPERSATVYEPFTVNDFAKALGVKTGEVMKKLMGMGIMVTGTQGMPVDAAGEVARHFGFALIVRRGESRPPERGEGACVREGGGCVAVEAWEEKDAAARQMGQANARAHREILQLRAERDAYREALRTIACHEWAQKSIRTIAQSALTHPSTQAEPRCTGSVPAGRGERRDGY